MKLDLPFSKSYHPISCRINDVKYLIRIRVTCELAARLKQHTHMNWAIICIAEITIDAIKNAIESLIISASFSSVVAFVL